MNCECVPSEKDNALPFASVNLAKTIFDVERPGSMGSLCDQDQHPKVIIIIIKIISVRGVLLILYSIFLATLEYKKGNTAAAVAAAKY